MTVVQSAKRKVSRSLPYQPPAGGNSGAEGGANENVVVQIPDHCLTRAGVVKGDSPASRCRQNRRRLPTPTHRAESAQKRSRLLHKYLSMRIPTIWCHMRCWKSNAVITSTDCLSARSKRTPLSGQTFCPWAASLRNNGGAYDDS